jgi:hypothetical protein
MTATLDDNVADLRRVNAELQQKLDDRTRERDEALEQQTATAEVLQVINSSPGELAPVFDAMLEKALSLCDAVYGHVYTYDGERVHPVAIRGEAGFVDWLQQLGPYRPGRGSPMELAQQCLNLRNMRAHACEAQGLLAHPRSAGEAGAEPDHQAPRRDLLERRDGRGLRPRMAIARDSAQKGRT